MTRAPDEFGAWVPGPRCERAATGAGPLDGMRLAVKDLIDVEGTVTGDGNPDWATAHAAAQRDAPAVARLRAAGARVVGKTVSDELAFSLEGENARHGTPRNPRAPGRLPGGSSSGSAVAVAAGLADLALGTDTGGSVRVPASFCGVWGMRPTHGRIPLQGVVPFAPSYDTVGWFARDAVLLEAAGQALLQSESLARPPLRLRIALDAIAVADTAVSAALHALGVRLGIAETVHAFEGASWKEWLQAYGVLQGLEIGASPGPRIHAQMPRFGANVAPRFEGALALNAAEGALALNAAEGEMWRPWRARAARHLHDRLGEDEAWLVPAAPGVPLPLTASEAARSDFYAHALALGALAGHAGLPQVVMPLATVHGLPVGVSFIAAPGNDERLLALAAACEFAMEGWT